MRRQIEYICAIADSIVELEKDINEYLNNGYELYGKLYISLNKDSECKYIRELIKYKEEK